MNSPSVFALWRSYPERAKELAATLRDESVVHGRLGKADMRHVGGENKLEVFEQCRSLRFELP